MPFLVHFWAQKGQFEPKKGQKPKKSHWYNQSTHVDGPFGDSSSIRAVNTFQYFSDLGKKSRNMHIYIGSPLWNIFFDFFFENFIFSLKSAWKDVGTISAWISGSQVLFWNSKASGPYLPLRVQCALVHFIFSPVFFICLSVCTCEVT